MHENALIPRDHTSLNDTHLGPEIQLGPEFIIFLPCTKFQCQLCYKRNICFQLQIAPENMSYTPIFSPLSLMNVTWKGYLQHDLIFLLSLILVPHDYVSYQTTETCFSIFLITTWGALWQCRNPEQLLPTAELKLVLWKFFFDYIFSRVYYCSHPAQSYSP